MHKDPGKTPAKQTNKKPPAASHRAGLKNSDSKSWFSKPSRPAKKEPVQIRSASSPSLANNNNNENKKINKRPLTVIGSSNVTLRRGQQPSKIEAGQTVGDDLSRHSSITNLNDAPKNKGAKPKKAESKDKLDRLDRKKSKNNNSDDDSSLVDVETLQKQLALMANEKTNLALQLADQTGQLHTLQNELGKLKMLQDEAHQKVEHLSEENTILRNRLRDVAHSPLSDNEKQQLLYESRHHSSAPASIATNLLDDGGDITACPTPEWDKHSSSNVSEVSVACLQDKINQMQETHYSTNEELQATLQELTDLQRQLTELQQENLRLNDEKNLMFESLCRQTERLNDSRNEVESLKQLLYKDESGQFETAAEREQKLLDLLKSAQEERETLLLKQEQLNGDLEDSRSANLIRADEINQLSERVKTLESTLDAKHAEHKQLDQELALAKDQSSGRQIEINRLRDLLENARTKIAELEQDRALSDKSELDELLDNARKEKDALESEVAHLKEQLALSKNESEKLREQVSILQEECKVIRNNAKTTQSDLEYKLEKVVAEKNGLSEQLQQFQEAVNELQVQAQCQSDDKRQLSAVLSETQRNLNESERKVAALESELAELKKVKQEQEEEWEKFQNDLLTSVRVANDFKTEAQQDLQKLIMENKAGRERIKQLETQIEKMKGNNNRRRSSSHKNLSKEEKLMASLNRRYKEIEDLPNEELTEEQKAIKVLKTSYDQISPKTKPKARKPKDKLAISKPSLNSVISNPKLGDIVKDPKLQNVEKFDILSDQEEEEEASFSGARLSLLSKVQSEGALPLGNQPNKQEELIRSRSLTDLSEAKLLEEEPNLKRYDSTDNLLVLAKPKLQKKSTVTFDTLEEICKNIPPNTPEEHLTKEQKLALKMREFLSKESRKTTLKKQKKLRRSVPISRPTQESVEQNAKLLLIIKDPIIRSVTPELTKVRKRSRSSRKNKSENRYSLPASLKKPEPTTPHKSKSYNDISFKFNNTINMYSEEEENRTDFALEDVLPPEEFRDVKSEVVTTFDTFKTEHACLDSSKLEVDSQDLDYMDDGKTEDSEDFKDGPDFVGVCNETLLRVLDKEDNAVYGLDDEEIRARHGARKRFSEVVDEIKEKFDRTDEDVDEDEDSEKEEDEDRWETTSSFTAVPAVVIEDVSWEEVILEENGDKPSIIEEGEEVPVEKINEELKKAVDDAIDRIEHDQADEMFYIVHEDVEEKKEENVPSIVITDITDEKFFSTIDENKPENEDKDKEIEEKAITLKKEIGLLTNKTDNSDTEEHDDNISDKNEDEEELQNIDFKFMDTNLQNLEKEEIDLIDSAKQKHDFPRLSEFKNEDFNFVDEMKKTYLKDDIEEIEKINLSNEEIGSTANSEEKSNVPRPSEVDETKEKEDIKIDKEKADFINYTQQKYAFPDGRNEELKKAEENEEIDLNDSTKQKVSELNEDVSIVDGVKKPKEETNLEKEEIDLIDNAKQKHNFSRLSDVKSEDFNFLDQMRDKYLNDEEEDIKTEEEKHFFPRILSPTKLYEPSTYEPVYANCQISPNKNSETIPPPQLPRKPKALPRLSSLNSSDQPIYRDFGGQVTKTRFSITYDRDKNDEYIKTKEEKRLTVKDLRSVFENKSKSDLSSSVSNVLEDEE